MGKLGTPQRTEPVSVERSTLESDGYNGSIGVASTVYSFMGVVRALKSTRLLEANQQSLRQGYTILMWVDPNFEPQQSDIFLYRDERLSLQGYRYTDETRRRYELTVLEGVNGSISNQA